jgi:Skp family chaperone for outer membrane proteins
MTSETQDAAFAAIHAEFVRQQAELAVLQAEITQLEAELQHARMRHHCAALALSEQNAEIAELRAALAAVAPYHQTSDGERDAL